MLWARAGPAAAASAATASTATTAQRFNVLIGFSLVKIAMRPL
jgi:hypothetical protein